MSGKHGTTVDLSGGTTTVSPRPAVVSGVFVNVVLSTHSIEIRDGSVMKFTIPADAAAGSSYDLDDTRFETNLVVAPNAASTGNITLTYIDLVREPQGAQGR